MTAKNMLKISCYLTIIAMSVINFIRCINVTNSMYQCNKDELFNITSGLCVHGLFLVDEHDRYGQWRTPIVNDPLKSIKVFDSYIKSGFLEFDVAAVEALNSLLVYNKLKIPGGYGNVARIDREMLVNHKCFTGSNHTFAMLVRCKNMAWSLNEYMAHYTLLGTNHIFIIDDFSTDNLLEIAQPWIEAGFLTIVSGVDHDDYFIEMKKYFDWVAFIDFDEYIMPFKNDCLHEVFDLYKDYGGIKLGWIVYEGKIITEGESGNGLFKRRLPNTTLYEAIHFKLGSSSLMGKEIGQSKKITGKAKNMPHCLKYIDNNTFPVDEKFLRADGRDFPTRSCFNGLKKTYDVEERLIALLHIHAITLEEWIERCVRVFHSVPHDREKTIKRFDFQTVIEKYDKKLITVSEMPQKMLSVAQRLSKEMKALVKFS